MEEKPDYLLFGHFHSAAALPTNSGQILVNGGFLGGDMYSLRDLRKCSIPTQKMFGIHKNKGITWNYDIHLDKG